MDFYKLAGLYTVKLSRPGAYQRLQAALGFAPDHVWTTEERRSFRTLLLRCSGCLDRLNTERLSVTCVEALLITLQIHPYGALREASDEQLQKILSGLWPDIRIYAEGGPVSIHTAPDEGEKSLLSKLLSPVLRPHPVIGFVYDWDPKTSAWAAAHAEGQ